MKFQRNGDLPLHQFLFAFSLKRKERIREKRSATLPQIYSRSKLNKNGKIFKVSLKN